MLDQRDERDVDIWTIVAPGITWQRAMPSAKSSAAIQRRWSTRSGLSYAIIAGPP